MARGRRRARRVLLLGDFRYTPVFGRSLARKGLGVVVAHSSSPDFARRSRFTDQILLAPFTDAAAFGPWLKEAVAADPAIVAVMALGDKQAELLAECAGDVPDHVACVVPPERSVHICTDKLAMCELAASLDVPQAAFEVVATIGDAVDATARIGFPCVVKPVQSVGSGFSEKAVILPEARHLDRLTRFDPATPGPFLVQRFVSGRRYNVQFLAHKGRLVDRLVTQTLRTDRANDTGYTVESITVPPSDMMDRAAHALVEALEYSGFGCLQFFGLAGTEQISFLEINPRLGGAFAIADTCGVDFPGLAADVFIDHRPGPAGLSEYPAGKRMVWTGGDLLGIRTSLARGDIDRGEAVRWLGRAATAFVRADAHPTLTVRDPLLALRYYGRSLDRFSPRRILGARAGGR